MTFSRRLMIQVGSCALVLMAGLVSAPLPTYAISSTQGVPDQASCESGSTTYTWNGMAIARPVIASMSVDGEVIADPTNPAIGSIGAAICANVELGRRSSLFVYHHVDAFTNDMELSAAVTPTSHAAITADSKITITMTNMGDLAKYFSFALVHGHVDSWTTANLGTDAASLTFTFSPVRTPFGSGDDFAFCTATPPNCHATQSQADALSASLDMTFDQTGYGSNFAGSYFGLTGAMGGWVEAAQGSDGERSLVATLGGPHFLADGSTANVGNMQAFLPNAVLENLLGLAPGTVNVSALSLTRTESGTTGTAPFTISAVDGGAVINVSDITFSSPVYTIKKAAAVAVPGLPNTGNAPVSPYSSPAVAAFGIASALATGLVLARRKS
ncbi:MAG TPA: hypothetical protein VLA04_05795 [Verrucomicrobiae bacterium]|nr:hypothetical protein [Verrucomicrobiae bacterium]